MSKITFRADEDLIRRLEEFEASKSEVMRQALREYLEREGMEADRGSGWDDVDGATLGAGESVEDLIAERMDAMIAERVNRAVGGQDINVNITLDENLGDVSHQQSRKTATGGGDGGSEDAPRMCKQCGEGLDDSDVYCSNCGEKASHRVFCECGDELRSDWGFCPSCGRRTPAADVLSDS